MRTSLAARIFLFVVCTLVALLIIQWLVVSRSFLGLYRESITSSMQRELERVTDQYKFNRAQMHFIVFFAFLFCLILLVVDLIYAFLDPRIKAQYSK